MKKLVLIMALSLVLLLSVSGTAFSASLNGSAGQIPAYYDGNLHTINLFELSSSAASSILAHNKSVNHIYEVEPNEPSEELTFISVIDAIQGDGFNPLWQEVRIVFNPGHTPHQFFSDDQVLTAASNGEITLIFTNEVYRCSVVGPKK